MDSLIASRRQLYCCHSFSTSKTWRVFFFFFISLHVQVPAMNVKQQRTQNTKWSRCLCPHSPVDLFVGRAGAFISSVLDHEPVFKQRRPQLLLDNTIHFGSCVWIHESQTCLSFLTLEQIRTHGFTFHYSYNRLFVLLCPVLFMEVTFCGYNNKVK